jgi:adenosylcobinamide-phosphate synthase
MDIASFSNVFLPIICLTPIFAIIIDGLIGDPNYKHHPVMLIGNSISFFKRKFRSGKKTRDKFAGFLLIFLTFLISSSLLLLIQMGIWFVWGIWNSSESNTLAWWEILIISFIFGYLLKWSFAIRNLGDVVKPIQKGLETKNIDMARQSLSQIVRRNTKNLEPQYIISASVEVVAESSTDAAISVFWFYYLGTLIGATLFILSDISLMMFIGIPFAYLFRIINTGDSVVGYKDEENINIGWFSAKADDWSNYFPTRFTVYLMLLVGKFMKLNTLNAKKVVKRDAHTLESVNAGWTMGTMAGLLDVQLEKQGKYKLGTPTRSLIPKDIEVTFRLIRLTILSFVILATIISAVFIYLIMKL